MPSPAIRIRIGASVDASAMRAFETIERRSQKAQQAMAKGAAAAGAAQARAASQAAEAQARGQDMVAKRGRKAADEWAKSLISIGKIAERELMRQARAVDRSRRTAGVNFAQRVSHRTSRFLTPNAPLGSIASQTARDISRGLGVDFSVGGGLQRTRDVEQAAFDLANSGFLRGRAGPAGARQDPRAIIREARTQATEAGVGVPEAITGLQAFVAKTGDLATGRAVLGDMAKLSKATGANLMNMVDAAGDVSAAIGDVANSEDEARAKAEAVRNVMRVIAGQGKLMAVEVKQLSTQMAKVSTSATAFAGDRERNIATMGALAQMARQRGGAATANIAATSVASFVNTLRTPARRKAFEGAGVELEAGGGKFRDPQEIIIDAIKAAGEDTAKFKSMFANVQGARAVEGFRQIFLEAGGGAKGEKALRDQFRELGAGAAITGDEEAESLARALSTTTSKAQIFQNKLDEIQEQAAAKLIPALEKAGPGLLKLAEALGNITTWVVENPKTAIAGAISMSIARAGLESVLRSGIENLILGAGNSRAAAIGGIAGKLGAAGTIASLAITSAVIGMAVIDHLFNKAEQEERKRFASDVEVFNKEQGVERIAADDPAKAAKILEQTIATREKNLSATKESQTGFLQWLGKTVGGLVDPDAIATREQSEKQTVAQQERELAASRALLQQISNSLSGGITIKNLPQGGDLPPREPQ